MSKFRQQQFEVIARIVNRFSIRFDNQLQAHNLPLDYTNEIINSFVDELCKEFKQDNYRFNETLFRSQCGTWINSEHING